MCKKKPATNTLFPNSNPFILKTFFPKAADVKQKYIKLIYKP